MNQYVADAHALFWYLIDSPKLGRGASRAFDEADRGLATIYIPAIVLAEFYFLNVKLGRPLNFVDAFRRFQAGRQYILLSMDPTDMLDFDGDAAVTEMHDRMIVGVARRRSASLLTDDGQIKRSTSVPLVW